MSDARAGLNDDLSALAWVHDELRRSLDAAHKALRRFLKEAESLGESDVDVVDPAVLRGARSQIHQGVGALELVGLPAAALMLRGSEAAVQRFVAKPHKLNAQGVDVIEHASFALLDYLTRLLANKPVLPLALFPQYRAVQELAGANRVHPADLWAHDWQWRELPADAHATARHTDEATHEAFEAQLLASMRATTGSATSAHTPTGGIDPMHVAARMSEIFADLGAGATQPQVATLWQLAAAMFEAQAQGLLGFDVFSKRVASRLLAQMRILERGETDVSERLAQDLLFFCAQSASPGDGRKAPRLAAVRQVFGLVHHVPTDYSASSLGRFDPATIVQSRKRVAAAKEAWSSVASGEMHRLAGLSEQFALVGDSLKRLFPHGESLATELLHAVTQAQAQGAAPAAPLAMEVATSLLYVEAALEDVDFDHPDQAQRVRRLAERLSSVRKGRPPEPLEAWMEELYRRISDRQTMGSVVQELRASLSESEKLIDQFFRKPEQRDVLIPVPGQLSAMRGVLSVLGMDHASAALLRMRDEVDALVSTEADPAHIAQAGVFDRLAGNLGALGFLIDMLSVQPQLAKSLFSFDADAGTLSPVMGRSGDHASSGAHGAASPAPVEPRLIEQAQTLALSSAREDVSLEEVARDLEHLSNEANAADQSALAAAASKAQAAFQQARNDPHGVAVARGELSEALVDFVSTASDPVGLAPQDESLAEAPITLNFGAPSVDLAQDDEMREIFLEEAREVLADARSARAELVEASADLALLTTLRRAFHTLKGSSRMVGLKEFGEAAWACEQLYNTHLADQRPADAPLLDFTAWSLAELGAWIEDIAAQRDGTRDAAAIRAAAQRVAEPGGTQSMPLESAAASAELATPTLPIDLPSAADLDLRAATPPVDAPSVIEPGPLAVPASEMSFELDLGKLDEPATPPASDDGARTDHVATTLSDPASLDVDAPAWQAPFDPQRTEVMPLADGIESSEPDPSLVGLDLDFGPAAADDPRELAQDHVKAVGPLRISIPLFNIYLNEADELSRRLGTELAEWALELHRPIGETPIALAHSLAGSSATVGFADLSQLARALEHAQTRSNAIGSGTPDEAQLFVDAAEEIRRLLHQFAAGFLKEAPPELLARLSEHERSSALRLEAATAAAELQEDEPSPAPSAEAVVPLLKLDPEPVAEPVPDTAPAELDARESSFDGAATRFDRLGVAELRPLGELQTAAPRTPAPAGDALDADDAIDAVDAIDAELFPIFAEEAEELLPRLAGQLRDWSHRPTELAHPAACMRSLHTLKGGARLAGAMRLGEMAHRLESRIERLLAQTSVGAGDVEVLQTHGDALVQTFEALRNGNAVPSDEAASVQTPVVVETAATPELAVLLQAAPLEVAPLTEPARLQAEPAEETLSQVETPAAAAAADVHAAPIPDAASEADLAPIDWSRFAASGTATIGKPERGAPAAQSAVRVRAPLLDRLVNQAGEVSITRSRIESGVAQIKGSLTDLTENLERLRTQLREIEFQGETQMTSRLEAAKAASQAFDPLEFDRFTRFQELARMMAESVNDVATVQRSVQRSLEVTEDELVAQGRLTRDLQDDLLRTRMVEFEGLSDRLYRVARQAAKETGKSVRLDIVGGSIEVDRGVLDRMTGAFEHLLRNCVTHGIEAPDARRAAGKEPTGSITVSVLQEGNEVGVEFRDDGAGLDLARIRAKGVALGLLAATAEPSDAELANLIFAPGFSTADAVTELAGRGVGMDVV
ncbi:MAG TPA: Hpt domain-containing protein, partial [Burkholderiaceae bacterium]|nr:Hpt domain-containing protein [Burkholderiaceae bacterium]